MELADGSRLGEHCHDGRPLLLDLADSPAVRETADRWGERVHVVTAKAAAPTPITAMLVRPDGYVAWVSEDSGVEGMAHALASISRPVAT